MKSGKILALAGLASCLAFAAPAYAGPVAAGFDGTAFPGNDDGYTNAINLGFSANYFGTTYTQTYVSNNGYITFNEGQSDFTPTGLGAGYSGQPIIAPFFADVDTTGSGSGLTSYGTGMYAGHNAFGATWPGVGYYSEETDKLNTFQVILTDRSDTGTGNFDIYFNYDSIQWETGEADDGVDGLGGDSASVGYNAGTGAAGTYFEFLGSLVNGAFLDGGPHALAEGTNNGVTGQYLFNVRNGQVAPPPNQGGGNDVPEPATLALFGLGLAGLGLTARRRRKA